MSFRSGLIIMSVALAFASTAPPPLYAQGGNGTVRGTVTRAPVAAPVVGAQVFVVGTRVGAVTGNDGRYTITGVPLGTQIIRVRTLGFQPAEKAIDVTAGEPMTADFTVTATPVALDEVVVTGTAGSARKREVGNSIGQIKVSDAPEVSSNVSNLISGRMAGVTVAGGTGNSGSGSAIRLRGTTSVALSNQPLIYVDGVRTRSDEYPRNGIFTGTTQRGANAYGSPLNDINPDDIERIEVVKGAAAATLFGTDAAAGVIQIFTKRGVNGAARWQTQFNTGFNKLQKFGTDSVPLLFMDPFVRNGKRYGMSAQVTGGAGDAFRYLVSGGADNTQGVLPNDDEKKYLLRTNMDFLPLRNVAMSWSSGYTNNRISQTPAGNNAQGITLNAFRRDRNYFGSANPDTIRRVLEQELKSDVDRLILGTTITATPITNFSSRFTIGFDRAAIENRNLRPYGFPAVPFGVIQDQRWQNTTLSTDWVNSYDLSLTSALKMTASAGVQYVNSLVSDVVGFSENFPSPGDPTVASGSLKNADENQQRVITGGAFGQSLFGFKDRYFLTVGARIDGNSAFGEDFGFQTYPKFDLAYNVAPAGFLPELVSALKVRAAVGTAGRFPGAFDEFRTFAPITVYQNTPAVSPSNPGNPQLAPETTTEVEAGFEAGFFSDRLGVEGTIYRSRTKDALIEALLPPSQGFTEEQQRNIGAIENRGWEASINWLALQRGRFDWRTEFRADGNENEITDMGGVVLTDDRFKLGYPVGGIWSRKITGYSVVDGEPTFTRSDTAVFFGPPLPTSNFSWGNTFTYGPFQLYGLVTAERGAWFSNGDRPYRVRQQAGDEYLSTLDADGNPTFATDSMVAFWSLVDDIEKRDNVRIREISLVYQIPEALTGSIGFGRSTLTLSAQNVQWWDDCHCVDPNMNWEGAASFNQGSGFLADPAPRQFRASIRTRF